MISVKLPDIGEGVTEGELVKWLVKIGDKVAADQPVAEVMTDKATVEVPSPYAGVVKELKAKEGDTIPIETEILLLEGGEEKASAPHKPKEAKPPMPTRGAQETEVRHAAPRAGERSAGMEVHPPAADIRVLATPATRRLAREMGVNINNLSGTGLAGRVTREDVLASKGGVGAVSAGPAQMPMLKSPLPATLQGGEERIPLRGIRKKIAENLQMAKQVIPHFTLMDEACVDHLVKLRAEVREFAEKRNVKVTYLPFVMKALIATCREFPMLNASIDDQAQEIIYRHYFNIGFAADTPNGLVVPVVKAADQKTILQISSDIQALAVKAREGKLALEDMRGATITITNIGSVGGLYATPIINHPEVAILGMYKIQDKPVWVKDRFESSQVMSFTITCDHRLIDGAVAARFMKAFVARIENPGQMMLEMM